MYSERYANTVRPRPIENTGPLCCNGAFAGANAFCFEPAQCTSPHCASHRHWRLLGVCTSPLAVSESWWAECEAAIVMSCRFYTSGSGAEATVRRMLSLCTVSWSNLAPKFQSWCLVRSLRQCRLWKLIRSRKVKRYQGSRVIGFSINCFTYFKWWLKDIKHFEVFSPISQISPSL